MSSEIVSIVRAALCDDASQSLIDALNTELLKIYPEPGATHFTLLPEEVSGKRGAFLVVYRNAKPVGCGAVRLIDSETGEIKRMYMAPSARGQGLGRQLIEALEKEARELGVKRLVLETGAKQSAAIRLYKASGFRAISLYGEYCLSPETSLCFGKEL